MSAPKPSEPLEGHCSAIANNVLYVLSPTALQSLPLRSNATWSEQATGESVTGPACVTVVPDGDESSAALYVIGGESTDTSYSGLQRYFFGNNTWETLSPLAANVIQDRTNHSAVYLNESQSILIYAGSQPSAPSYFSSQTFVMEAVPPFNIEAFTSDAPPLNLPILEPWNSSHAIMVGGSASNTDVWMFGASDGWNQFPTNLSQPLDSSTKASVIDGSDGSMVLQVFGFGTSPNTVVDVVLLDANGATSPTGQVVGTNATTSSKKRRRLSIGSWPVYNSTNAPTATRTDSSLAVSSNGIIVVSGGNDASPFVLFNQNEDSWIDASTFFSDASAASPSGSGVASATGVGSGTTAATSAATSTAFNEKAYHRKTITALGAILGTLAGLALLFVLILVFLSYRRKKAAQREAMVTEKGGNDRMSFADRGASFMREAGPGAGTATAAANNNDDLISRAPPGLNNVPGGNSHSSLAIMSGRHNGTTRNATSHAQKASYDSTARLVNDRNNSVVSEPMEMIDIFDGRSTRDQAPPDAAGASGAGIAAAATLGADLKAERKRSSGWSKYFATSQATGPNGLSHIPSVYVKRDEVSGDSPYAAYSTPSQVSRLPSSVMVAPLDIDFSKTADGQRLSHVASGSPSFFDSREDLANRGSGPDGQKGLIVDPPKSGANSISSYGGNRSATSSLAGEYYNDGESPWTPVSTFKDHVNGERPTSSLYTNSIYESGNRKYSRGKSPGFFPGAGTSYKSNRPKTSHSAAPTSDWAAPQPPPPVKVADDRTSTLTVFPRGVPSGYYTQTDDDRQNGGAKLKPANTDMSWLNLGLNKAQV